MEYNQLRYFLQIYIDGSIQQAARHMNISQQALSKQLKDFESSLGAKLFDRSSSGVTPTNCAHVLAPEASMLVSHLEQLEARLKNSSNSVSGVVTMGILCWHAGGPYSRITLRDLDAFPLQFPNITFSWRNLSPSECRQGVLNETLDFALTTSHHETEQFDIYEVLKFYWVMIMPNTHPLAMREALRLEDLAGQTLIIPPDELRLRQQIISRLSQKEQPKFILCNDSLIDIISQQVYSRSGMLPITSSMKDIFNPAIFAAVPLDMDIFPTKLYIISKRNKPLSPAADFVMRFFINIWGKDDQD